MNKLEKDIEKALRKMVESHGGVCLKWVCPGWSGVPDRIILLPRGRILFVETKRPKGGQISALQHWWRQKLQVLGFTHYFVFNQEDIDLVRRDIERRIRREDIY